MVKNNNLVDVALFNFSAVSKVVSKIMFTVSYLAVSVFAFRTEVTDSHVELDSFVGAVLGILCLYMSYAMISKIIGSGRGY